MLLAADDANHTLSSSPVFAHLDCRIAVTGQLCTIASHNNSPPVLGVCQFCSHAQFEIDGLHRLDKLPRTSELSTAEGSKQQSSIGGSDSVGEVQ